MTFPSDAHSIVIPQAAGPQEKLSEYPGLSVPSLCPLFHFYCRRRQDWRVLKGKCPSPRHSEEETGGKNWRKLNNMKAVIYLRIRMRNLGTLKTQVFRISAPSLLGSSPPPSVCYFYYKADCKFSFQRLNYKFWISHQLALPNFQILPSLSWFFWVTIRTINHTRLQL